MKHHSPATVVRRSLVLLALVLMPALKIDAQRDPGPRAGAAGAGLPIPGLSAKEAEFFTAGLADFREAQSVRGPQPNQPDTEDTGGGLGPRFNSDSCGSCHSQPATGGTSPSPTSLQNPTENPQASVGQKNGGTNLIPFFIHTGGPIREARFKYQPDGSRDGGVHDLFVITGRNDAAGCTIRQPDFTAAAAQNNLSFRIPTPVFGAGLIEAIPDSTILANKKADRLRKALRGISGRENRNGNDGTITRFGWKAQNKSLELFAAEAYNVEQGVTSEIFNTERDETPGCLFNGTPEDHTFFDADDPQGAITDVMKFTHFMRFLAPPTPAPDTPSIARGRLLFNAVGCALCHTPSLTTGVSSSAALSNRPVQLFSDLLLHNMGRGLTDDIVQGAAGPEEFRTAPLWGLGQRIFLLHDGRTRDLLEAIEAHSSDHSEANAVIYEFKERSASAKQDILNFLRAL
ncbi:MAG: thiol oxidoreductase [Acidobacteria bacterium]|nr:MAG: thiol oxidoreductase [Acidobacteriota bacterium]